jgi:hypothetical protein
MRRGLGATTAIIIAALIGAAPASAGTTSALPTTTLSPAEGASHPASNYPVATDAEMLSFSLDLADGFTADYPVTVEIATAPTLGQDGTLADENQVGTFDLVRGDAAPQHYSGAIPTFAEWAAKPGKYYWVAHTFGVDRRAHQLRAAPGGRRAAL